MVVSTDEIAGFYKDDLVLLITSKGQKYVVDYSLEELMMHLPPRDFFRISRQAIVYIHAIQEARPEGSQLALTMKVGFPKTLYVSQRNIKRFKNWMDEEI